MFLFNFFVIVFVVVFGGLLVCFGVVFVVVVVLLLFFSPSDSKNYTSLIWIIINITIIINIIFPFPLIDFTPEIRPPLFVVERFNSNALTTDPCCYFYTLDARASWAGKLICLHAHGQVIIATPGGRTCTRNVVLTGLVFDTLMYF